MDYTAWKFWMDVMQMAGTIAIGVYVWWSNREKVNAKRFTRLEDEVKLRATQNDLKEAVASRDQKCAVREQKCVDGLKGRDLKCDKHAGRTDSLESSLRSMPSRSEIAGLTNEISHFNQKLGRLEGRLDGLNRVADLINEFLINQGAKR